MAPQAQDQVVDASVVVKWFFPESDSDKALSLRDLHLNGTITLYAPLLLIYEVANTLRYRPDISQEDLNGDIEALFLADLELIPPSSTASMRAAQTARKLGITSYDATYLELAHSTGKPLVTADGELFKRTKKTRLVKLLSSL